MGRGNGSSTGGGPAVTGGQEHQSTGPGDPGAQPGQWSWSLDRARGLCHGVGMGAATTSPEPVQGTEAEVLTDTLDRHRAALRRKCADLTHEQLNHPLPPTTMTLAGLLKHLAVVESGYFSEDLLDEPLIAPFDTVDWSDDRDWEWHTASQDTPRELLALFDASVAESRRITQELLATPEGLDTLARRPTYLGVPARLRWILAHMIEEYARHNGHADLLREVIDGQVGE